MGGTYGTRILWATSVLTVAVLLTSFPAFAGTGTFGSYIGIDDNSGSGNVWYGGNQPGPNTLDAFNGKWLGDYTIGDTMNLSGAELLSWKNGSGDVTGAMIHFSIYETTAAPVTWNTTTINFSNNAPFSDAAGNNFTNTGDQKWAAITATPDILYGVGNGLYDLAVYFEATSNEGTLYDNNGGSNYVAQFRVGPGGPVFPEPSTFLLLFVGLLLPLTQIRKRNKS